jgi:hypothetical protein
MRGAHHVRPGKPGAHPERPRIKHAEQYLMVLICPGMFFTSAR